MIPILFDDPGVILNITSVVVDLSQTGNDLDAHLNDMRFPVGPIEFHPDGIHATVGMVRVDENRLNAHWRWQTVGGLTDIYYNTNIADFYAALETHRSNNPWSFSQIGCDPTSLTYWAIIYQPLA